MPSTGPRGADEIRDVAGLEARARAAGATFLAGQELAGISAPMAKLMRSGDGPLSMANFDFLDYQALQGDLEAMRTTLRTGQAGPAHAALADQFDGPAIAATVSLAYMTTRLPDQEEQVWRRDLFRSLLIESIPAAKADALLGDSGIRVKPLDRQLRQALRAQLEPAWRALGAPRPMPRLVFTTPFLGEELNIVGLFKPLARPEPRILIDSYTLARFLAVLEHPALDDTSPDPFLLFWQKAHRIWGNLGGPGEILLHELSHAADHLVIGERGGGPGGFEVAVELGLTSAR